jgi:hypothetical protein
VAYAARLNQFSRFGQPVSLRALAIAAFRPLRGLAAFRSAAKIRPRPGALFGFTVLLAASTPAGAANDPLVPAKTPLGYNVGVAYETNVDGRTGRSISADLDQITQYFWLVRTYHDTADPNSTTPTISLDENQVIQYALAHPALSLVMGTYNSALVLGNNTTGNICTSRSGTFSAGLMTSKTYTDAWVQMLIGAFGGNASAVAHSVKTILLGNEVDFPGQFVPGPQDPAYSNYLTWIESAFSNMKSSLSSAGLGNIPVTVTLAFSPVSGSTPCPNSNAVSTQIPQYITNNWSPSWNGAKAFVLYDSYPSSSPPKFSDITGYLQQVVASPAVHNEVFLGETGVQSPGGDTAQEASFYQQMFAFLGSEWRKGGITLPAFAFQAFDYPGLGQQTYGLFSQNGSFQPTGLKAGIKIPCWVAQPLTTLAVSHDFNCDGKSDIAWRDTSGNTAVWLMNGATVSSSGGIGTVPSTWSIVGQRDFDGNGTSDLLWRDTSGNTSIWFMNGTTITPAAVGNIPPTWNVVATGDFNGDGLGDILWQDNGGNLAVWLMNGATVSSSGAIGNVPIATWSIAGTGDYNGDGKTDLLWRDNSGNTSIWFMNGTTVGSTAGVGNIPTTWSVVGTGDFNADGMSDIVWRDNLGNTSIWLMNGAAVLSAGGLGNIPTNWSIVQTGDYDGNGMSDLLWRDNLGNTSIWFMNGAAVASAAGVGNIPTNWTVQSTNAE